MQRSIKVDSLKKVTMALSVPLAFELAVSYFFGGQLDHSLLLRLHIPTVIAVTGIFLAAAVSYYEYHGFGPHEGIVRRGPHQPYVSLTFDDGPNPTYTPQILDVLAEKGATATFFMVGKHVQKYPEVARRVCAEGHEIGNHTFSHREMVTPTKKTVLKEVNMTDEVIGQVVGVRTRLFRPPRGLISNAVRRILVENGFAIALWTVSAVDWRGYSPKQMVRRILRHARPGGIILFHDSGALIRSEGGSRVNTVDALPLVIDALRGRGYEIVSLSKMLRDMDHAKADGLITEFAPSSASQEA